MRPIGSHNENERAASLEKMLEDGINKIGLDRRGCPVIPPLWA